MESTIKMESCFKISWCSTRTYYFSWTHGSSYYWWFPQAVN